MTSLVALVLIAVVVVSLAGPVGVWARRRRWRVEERNTRLLTGIADLRRKFREGRVHLRLTAEGNVETAVNGLLDDVVTHFRGRRAEAEGRARALDVLAGVVSRTVEQLDAAVVQAQGLGVELERKALGSAGDASNVDALAALRAGDERFAGQCQTAAALADQSRSAASACQRALTQLRASLTELGGITRASETLRARWATVRTSVDDVVRVAEATRLLAVSAALAIGREHDARDEFGRFAAEADEVAHGVTRGVAQMAEAVATCEQGVVTLSAAGDPGRPKLDVATDGVPDVDGALAWIEALPSSLAELATALSGIAESRSQATASLANARPDASRLADELQSWTAAAQRVGSELARATGALAAARREARRLLEAEAAT